MTNVVPRLIQARTDLASMHATLDAAADHVGSAAQLLQAASTNTALAAGRTSPEPMPMAPQVQGALALARAELASVTSELVRSHLTQKSDALVSATQGAALLQSTLEGTDDARSINLGSLATELQAVSRRLSDAGVTAAADGGAIDQALRVVTGVDRPLPAKVTIGDLRASARLYLPLADGTRRVIGTVGAMNGIVSAMAPRTNPGPGPYEPVEAFENRGVLALGRTAQDQIDVAERVAEHLPDGSQVGRFLDLAENRLSTAFDRAPGELGPAPALDEGVLLDASVVRTTLDHVGQHLEDGAQQAVAERRALLAAATYGTTRLD